MGNVASARTITALDVLGDGGIISKQLPRYEARDIQVKSAQLAQQGIENGEHVIFELGTGGGKSLAGLTAALISGRKVVYATYMLSLQQQIAEKDAPFISQALEKALGRRITYTVLKGRGNYACLKNMDEMERSGAFRSPQAATEFPAFAEWVGQQRTAQELADIGTYPGVLPSDLRMDVVTSTEECTGQKCPFYGECFAERAKQRAKDADIVVANHKLLALDAMIREQSEGYASALPDYSLLIIDEAHNLEGVIRDTAGFEITPGRLTRLGWMLQKYTINHAVVQEYREDSAERKIAQEWAEQQEAILHRVFTYLEQLKAQLQQNDDAREMRMGDERPVKVGAQPLLADDDRPTIHEVATQLVQFGSRMEAGTPLWLEDEDRDSWLKLADQTIKLGTELLLVISPDADSTMVRRASLDGDNGKTRVVLEAKPIDVAPIGRRWFFGSVKKQLTMRQGGKVVTVAAQSPLVTISMSATIATSGTVRMYAERVGVSDYLSAVHGSPFDYRQNALVFLAGDAEALTPVQKRDRDAWERYVETLCRNMRGLTLDARGGAFLLFTSRSMMNEVHERISGDLEAAGLLVLKQGDYPLKRMVEMFKADGNAVLFGLKTFGEGVDVQGDALRLVAIDKVPFNPPTDVIWKALKDHIDRNGGNSFRDLDLPNAIITLKQFAGRLIRSKTDRGVIALLDGRLRTKRYGDDVLRNMPDGRITSDPADVQALYASMRGEATRPALQARSFRRLEPRRLSAR
jgi:ATP-dependent DNA helicase DinG